MTNANVKIADEPDWEKVRSEFPVNSELIWLNNCGTTPVATPVKNAVKTWLDAYGERGVLARGFDYADIKRSIQKNLAELLGGHPDEFALLHNTAEGMNFLSHGFALLPGDEILLLENEYPSNVYPWEHWREKGVVLKTVPVTTSPQEFLSAFQSALTPKTRIASLSAVHWCTGMPLPLKEIARLCKGDVRLVVDGSQGAGLVDLDMRGWGLDFMAFSAWKWLLGPLGLGVLYISRESLDKVKPVFKGTESVIRDTEYLPYKSTLKPTTDRFAYSTGNFNDWVYFEASLAYLAKLGFARVRERIQTLAAYLSDALRNLGFQILSDDFGAPPSGIVVASKSGLDSAEAVKALKAKDIIAAERLGRIRFSPHVYNSAEQLDRVVAVLSDLVR